MSVTKGSGKKSVGASLVMIDDDLKRKRNLLWLRRSKKRFKNTKGKRLPGGFFDSQLFGSVNLADKSTFELGYDLLKYRH